MDLTRIERMAQKHKQLLLFDCCNYSDNADKGKPAKKEGLKAKLSLLYPQVPQTDLGGILMMC